MSNLSVIINFILPQTEDPKIICVADASNWGMAENQPAYLTVLPPGSVNYISLNFVKHSLTFLNSTNLGLSCITSDCSTEQAYEDLDDGIWEICLKSSYEGLDKKRFHLKTDSLRQDIDKIYIKSGIDYHSSSKVIEDLSETEYLLNVAHAQIRRGDKQTAIKAFKMASKLVDKYKNCI